PRGSWPRSGSSCSARTRPAGGRRAADSLFLRERLEIDRDRDVVTNVQAAVVEGLVPVDAVVLPVQLRLEGEAGALVAPRILLEAEELDRERDALRHPVHRQVAGDVVDVLRLRRRDGRRLEADLRVLLGVEEVGRAEM